MMKILKAVQNVEFIIIPFDENDVKVRCHCHVTGKLRGASKRDCNINCNINGSLNYKIPIVFFNLKIYHNGHIRFF